MIDIPKNAGALSARGLVIVGFAYAAITGPAAAATPSGQYRIGTYDPRVDTGVATNPNGSTSDPRPDRELPQIPKPSETVSRQPSGNFNGV